MKRVDRYLVREMIVPFLAGAIVIALLFDANQLIYVLKTYSVRNVPPLAMLQMIVLRTPYWLNFTLPAGVSLAASLAITRMARESEITALRACGMPMGRIILPVALFGVVVAAGNFYLVERVIPRAEAKAKNLEIEIGITNTSPDVSAANVWLTLKNRYHATMGQVNRQKDGTLQITGMMLGERVSDNEIVYTYADKATYKRPGIWTIPNFKQVQVKFDAQGSHVQTAIPQPGKPSVIVINQPIVIDELFNQVQSGDKTMGELVSAIKAGRQAGRDMTPEEITLQNRFSTPASCIIFAIVAPIFSIMFARTGSFIGLLLSFVLVLFYYNASVISTEVFGKNHIVSPILAAWLPNLICIGIGILGIRRLE